jgi:hypothetical protein
MGVRHWVSLSCHGKLGIPTDGGIVLPFRRYGNDEALLAEVVVAGSRLRVPLSTACGKAMKDTARQPFTYETINQTPSELRPLL